MNKTQTRSPSKLPQFFTLLIPLIEALADMEGSAKTSEVISRITGESPKTRESSKLLMQIHEARTFLTKTGYLVCPQRGIWKLTVKGRTQPIRHSDLPEIHSQNKGWRAYWFGEDGLLSELTPDGDLGSPTSQSR
jgi:hypothetical protein